MKTDDRGRTKKTSLLQSDDRCRTTDDGLNGNLVSVFCDLSSVVGPPSSVLGRPGGYSEEPIPDPIPNSAVKVLSADGTKPQGLEE